MTRWVSDANTQDSFAGHLEALAVFEKVRAIVDKVRPLDVRARTTPSFCRTPPDRSPARRPGPA